MRRLLLTLLALGLLLPATAGAAGTYKDIAYSVDYAGVGTYEKIDRYDYGEDTWHEEETSLDFTFEGQMNDGVVFRNGHPLDVSADDISSSSATGFYEIRGSGGTERCPVVDEDASHGLMRFTEPELNALDGETHVILRPFDRFEPMFDCGDSFPGAMLVDPWDHDAEGNVVPGGQQFDVEFTLPPEVFGMGYIQQLIPVQINTGARCPGAIEDATQTCKLEWSGKVILRKLWEKTGTFDDLRPAPAPTPAPEVAPPPPPKPPIPPKPPVADDDEFLIPLIEPGSAKVDASGKTATVTVTCGGGCAGTASVIAGGPGARAAASKPLASARFRVPAGRKKARVRIKLGSAARRKLRRARSAKLRLAFTKPTRRTQTLALKLRR